MARQPKARVVRRLDRDYKTATLSHPIKSYGVDVYEIRIYKPKLGDLKFLDLSMGEEMTLTIGDILLILARVGRDGEGDPIPDGWEDELDLDDIGPIMEIVGHFLGSGQPTGEGSPATSG